MSMYHELKSDGIECAIISSGSGEGGCHGILEHSQGRTCDREALNLVR